MSDELKAGKVVRIGDSVTLILGDCLAHLPIEADALISDPPYGIGHVHSGKGGDRKTLNGGKPKPGISRKIVGDCGPFDPSPWLGYPIVILWGANHYASKLPDRPCWLGWDKHLKEHGTSFSEWECAWTNLKARRARMFRLYWHGALRAGDANAAEHLHPTQKPVELMAWCMEVAKLPTDATVLDPYMGSGSTAIACIRTGRKFIGIERDPVHFATAEQRIRRELEAGTFDFAAQPASVTQQPLL
jgi:predicted RNA methylase